MNMLTRAALRAASGGAVFSVDEEDSFGANSTLWNSRDEARQAVEDGSQDCLVGTGRRQMQPDLGFQLDHARGDLNQSKA